eukprot:jgi/Tetstr1/425592/TSEL_016013.t1
MADQAATAAAAVAGLVNMEIDTHVARVIQVELAKTKTRVPATDIINASRILGARREHLRRTFDLLPEHLRYNEFTVVGVIQACLPNSAQIALEAAGRRANEPIDSYATNLPPPRSHRPRVCRFRL